MSVRVRPLEARDKPVWLGLFKGYIAFYQATVPEDVIETLWERSEQDPAAELTVDLEARELRYGGTTVGFELDDFTRWRLLNGLDDIGLTLTHTDDIDAYEAHRPAFLPTTLPAR